MPYFYNGEKISGRCFSIQDTQYPANWLDFSTQAERDALGIVWVDDPPTDPEIPREISIAQCCQYLLAQPSAQGNASLLDDVEAAIGQMPRSAQIDWQRRTSVRRDFPLVAQMQELFGWSDSRMDEMFATAIGL